MKRIKAKKAYLVIGVILSVFIGSTLVYGDSLKPGNAVSFADVADGAGMTSQGIVTLVSGMSGTTSASEFVTGRNDSEVAAMETPSTVRTANGKIRIARAHSGSNECQDSCSLN